MLTYPETRTPSRSIADRIRVTHRHRIEGTSPIVTRVSVVLLDGSEQFTIHGETWGADLQVYACGQCITDQVPTHLDSHDAVLAWAVRRIELGYVDMAVPA